MEKINYEVLEDCLIKDWSARTNEEKNFVDLINTYTNEITYYLNDEIKIIKFKVYEKVNGIHQPVEKYNKEVEELLERLVYTSKSQVVPAITGLATWSVPEWNEEEWWNNEEDD